MSVLSAIRKQDNPDGIEGHDERLKMQEESKNAPPKRNFTRGKDFHKYRPNDIRKPFVDKELALFAKQYCRESCCNNDCPLRGA